MQAMGLSWWETVAPMLDEGCLPVAKARELLALVESRPLTKETVARHYLEITENEHPPTSFIFETIKDLGVEMPKFDGEFNEYLGYISNKREELLRLLRKSIDLNEPLSCSL